MVPWLERPVLEVDLGKPIEERFRGFPAEAVAAGRELLSAVMKEIPSAARLLAYWVRVRTGGRFQREMVSLAGVLEADWREVMLANISYDLILSTLGCSTLAVATPSGPVVARNMDWWPEDILARSSYLVRFSRDGQFHFANAGWPGATGVVTGLSARGFAMVLNAVSSPEGIAKTGYPVLLHLRRVLEDAADYDAALKMLSEQKLAASAMITLAGTENHQRVVIERTPSRHALRRPKGDEPLVTTNHYRLLFQDEVNKGSQIDETTCARFDAACRSVGGWSADREASDEELLYLLSDPQVIQDITAQQIIMRPRTGEVRLFVPRRFLEAEGSPGAKSKIELPGL